MEPSKTGFYKAREFAELAGVTVRTLHHYDELGLLKPSAHSSAGYRLYSNQDLARLSQVTALRFIGMPLKEIKAILGGETLSLAPALRIQRRIMLTKRARIDAVIGAIERAQAAEANGGSAPWAALCEVIATMREQENWEWVKDHYTPEQLERLGSRYDPSMQETYSAQWASLITEIEAAKSDDPGGEKAQALAARWSALIHGFTNGEPDIEQSLKNVYAQGPAHAGFKKPLGDDADSFISKAIGILKSRR